MGRHSLPWPALNFKRGPAAALRAAQSRLNRGAELRRERLSVRALALPLLSVRALALPLLPGRRPGAAPLLIEHRLPVKHNNPGPYWALAALGRRPRKARPGRLRLPNAQ